MTNRKPDMIDDSPQGWGVVKAMWFGILFSAAIWLAVLVAILGMVR